MMISTKMKMSKSIMPTTFLAVVMIEFVFFSVVTSSFRMSGSDANESPAPITNAIVSSM